MEKIEEHVEPQPTWLETAEDPNATRIAECERRLAECERRLAECERAEPEPEPDPEPEPEPSHWYFKTAKKRR